MSIHYLDYAATTPLLPQAQEAWLQAQEELSAFPGNPSALHGGGRAARRMLEDARERVGNALGSDMHEVVFTSGATESDALAVVGAARGNRQLNPQRTGVLVSSFEHDAVKNQRKVLEREGFEWIVLPSTPDGRASIDADFIKEVEPRLALASLSQVCSELGSIQPVADLSNQLGVTQTLVHTDAAQGVSCLDFDFTDLGVDMATFGGHKVGAPVGVGALLIRRGTPFITDRPGGGHERGIRSGTPDVAGACAFAAALEYCVTERQRFHEHCSLLRQYIIDGLPHGIAPSIPPDTPSVPSIIHFSIPTSHPEIVLMVMDSAGVMVSAGSACHAGVTRPSEVVMAMGRSEQQAFGVLRVCLGLQTSTEDCDAFLAALPKAIEQAQALDSRDDHLGT